MCALLCALTCVLSCYCVFFPIPPTALFGISCRDDIFSYIENHQPNSRTHIFQRGRPNHQPRTCTCCPSSWMRRLQPSTCHLWVQTSPSSPRSKPTTSASRWMVLSSRTPTATKMLGFCELYREYASFSRLSLCSKDCPWRHSAWPVHPRIPRDL